MLVDLYLYFKLTSMSGGVYVFAVSALLFIGGIFFRKFRNTAPANDSAVITQQEETVIFGQSKIGLQNLSLWYTQLHLIWHFKLGCKNPVRCLRILDLSR